MEIIQSFFRGLWSMISDIEIPIINVHANTFIIGLFLIILIIECVNKILSKDNLTFEGK